METKLEAKPADMFADWQRKRQLLEGGLGSRRRS